MKKIITLLLIAGIGSSAFAQWRSSNNDNQNSTEINSNDSRYNTGNNNYQNATLVVKAYSKNGFTVKVDNGNSYNSNGSIVTVNSLTAGSHTVTVSEYRSSILGRQVPRVIYSSTINFKDNVETTLTIDNNGQANITERQSNGKNKNGKAKKNKRNKYPHDNRNHEKHGNKGHNDNDHDD